MLSKNIKEINILLNEPILFLTLPLAIIFMFFIYILNGLIIFRFGFLHSDRIGHFALNTELWLCEKKNNKIAIPTIDLFYIPTKICNKQLYKMWKKHFIFLPKIILRPFCLISRRFKFLEKHVAGITSSGDYDSNNLLDKYGTQIYFSNDEIKNGENELRNLGIPKNQKYVCLIVRDENYLKYNNPNLEKKHSHRNFDIESFKLTSQYLVKQGYYVIRMGSKVKSKISYSCKEIIDYANDKNRSDFLDIYLCANCEFSISTVTGLDAIPIIFRKTVFFIGSIPIAYMMTSSRKFINSIMDHYSTTLSRNLTLEEIFKYKAANIFSAEEFKNLNLNLIKPSPNQIKQFISNHLDYLDNLPEKKISNDQILFWKRFSFCCKKYIPDLKIHGEIRSIFDSNYLSNKEFLKK